MSKGVRHDMPEGRIPDEVVDAFFDRELDEGSRENLFRSLRTDLGRCEELARVQRAISMLREPVTAPDLTAPILARVSRKRGFLSERMRRHVKRGRVLVAGCALLLLLGVAATRRYAPQWTEWTSEPRPMSALIDSGRQEAASSVHNLAGTFNAVTSQAAPLVELGRRVLINAGEPGHAPAQRLYLVGSLTPGKLPTVSAIPQQRTGDLRDSEVIVYGGGGAVYNFRRIAQPDLESAFASLTLPLGQCSTLRAGDTLWGGGRVHSGYEFMFILPVTQDHGVDSRPALVHPFADRVLENAQNR